MEYTVQAEAFLPILTALTPLLARVPNEVAHDVEGYSLKLGGFYKDGQITIRPVYDGGLTFKIAGRYDDNLLEVYPHENLLDEIIQLQVERYRYWKDVKPEDFKTIDPSWLPILKEHGLVQEQVSYTIA